ncbi:hypothetical protein AV530_009577 [Patagioenas fasciata monilis]|uniref:Ig-like domain-containing protein n=1 Tax=Patagioenas fasciata monilis TaxID=372326 RepID=A0A1V4KS19_PATFA|nr:hypothetical protein AV530_009577 [Patagioenas fasciata monilis]
MGWELLEAPRGVRNPPRVPVLTPLLEPPEGQRAVLQCVVDSSPLAQLALFKDRALVASTAMSQPATLPRLGVTSAANTLRVSIQPVLLEDEGQYVCVATNAYGNASTSGNFTAGSE